MKWHTVYFSATAKEAIQAWPQSIKKDLGSVITTLQKGANVGMPDVKPMPLVSKGVFEIRIKDHSGAYRAFYLIENKKGIFVFHAFKKKTQKTPKKEIELGKKRLNSMIKELSL